MSNFKGTKGKWKLAENEYGYYTSVRNLDESRKVCTSRVNNQNESNANLLLISKSPEMLEMLEKVSIFIKENKGKNYMVELLRREVPEIEQLIKEATEL
jgi:hypothetical protein